MSDLLATYDRYCASGEINSKVADVPAAVEMVRARYCTDPDAVCDDLDGLTVTTPTWWFNLRPSNTEPLLRLNVEANDDITMQRIRDDVLALLRT